MSHPQTITKSPQQWPVTPNLLDYPAACRDFDWEDARRVLQGLPGGGLNMAFEAVDRHARGPLAQRTAFRFLDANGAQDMSYAELACQTNRFANVLGHLGVGAGEHLFVLAGRVPALYTAVLGSLKCGVVVTPLFSAFGPEPIATRVNLGRATVLVTTPMGTTEVEDSLLVPSTTLVTELQAWASEVAATVTEAIDGLHHILHSLENNHAVLRASAARPGLVVMAPDAKQSRGQASNDNHLEAMESPKSDAGGEVDQVIDMTECLTWIGDTIEEHLNGEQGVLPPSFESP